MMKMRYQATELGANQKAANTFFLVLDLSPKGEAIWVTNRDNQHLSLGHLSNDPALFLFELEDACAIESPSMRKLVILNALKHYGRPNLTWEPLVSAASMGLTEAEMGLTDIEQEATPTFNGLQVSMDDGATWQNANGVRMMFHDAQENDDEMEDLYLNITPDQVVFEVKGQASGVSSINTYLPVEDLISLAQHGGHPVPPEENGEKPAWAPQELPVKPVRARKSSADLGM